MIVSCDYRITTTGLYSDYILPAAQHYEKLGNSMPSVHHLNYVLCDKATPPRGNSLPDREIGVRLVEKIEERAAARGMKEFTDSKGTVHGLVGLVHAATLGGAVRDTDKQFEEQIADSAVYGVLPKGTTLQTLREKGQVRFTGWGMVGHGISQGSTIRPDEVHNPLRWHTEDKVPYDTLVRRAQFYIDHEWFLEAGEELATHKEPPTHGGANRRFEMTSGHNRWSIHSMNLTNNIIQNTYRGEPIVFINDKDAAELGIENGEQVKLVSNVGDCLLAAKITPSCRPGQVILYNGFEPYMHENWYSQADLEPGHVKHLGHGRQLRSPQVPRLLLAADSVGPGGTGGPGEGLLEAVDGPGDGEDQHPGAQAAGDHEAAEGRVARIGDHQPGRARADGDPHGRDARGSGRPAAERIERRGGSQQIGQREEEGDRPGEKTRQIESRASRDHDHPGGDDVGPESHGEEHRPAPARPHHRGDHSSGEASQCRDAQSQADLLAGEADGDSDALAEGPDRPLPDGEEKDRSESGDPQEPPAGQPAQSRRSFRNRRKPEEEGKAEK